MYLCTALLDHFNYSVLLYFTYFVSLGILMESSESSEAVYFILFVLTVVAVFDSTIVRPHKSFGW